MRDEYTRTIEPARALAAETELNDRIYRLFSLTPAEVRLLQQGGEP